MTPSVPNRQKEPLAVAPARPDPIAQAGAVAGAQIALSGVGGYAGPFGWALLIWSLFRLYPIIMWSLVGILVLAGVGYEQFREKPPPPPDPMVFTGRALPVSINFRRAKLSEHGLVVKLQNTSANTHLGTLWARRAGGKWLESRPLAPTKELELGWLELGQPLLVGDRVEVWTSGYDPLTVVVVDPDAARQQKQQPVWNRTGPIGLPPASTVTSRPGVGARPLLTTSFRGSVVGKGQVLVLTNNGTAAIAVITVTVNEHAALPVGSIGAGQFMEIGWLELDFELRTGDVVRLWIGKDLDQTVTVP